MVALHMHIRALALIVTLAAFAIACGSGGDSEVGPVRTPAASAPRNIIAFGATNEAGEHALFTMQADGTGVQELTIDAGAISLPRWSPDGDRIAYAASEGDSVALRVYNFDGAITTTVSDQLLPSEDAATFAWSPDGQQIAFIDPSEGGTLRIVASNGDPVADAPSVAATAVAWSPGGELTIVAPAAHGASTDIYTLQPDGDTPELLIERDGQEGGLAWSPDGETLAFWSAPGTNIAERALLTTTGDAEPEVVAPGTDAAWSPTSQLAYSGNTAVGEPGVLDVYRRSEAGLERLTQSLTLDRWSSWSPAEDALVYLAEADNSTAFLCLVTVATIDNNCVNLPGLNPTAPAWSPY